MYLVNYEIAFFSESNFDGKIPRDFDNMRTEYAWYVGLDAAHHYVGHLPSMKDHMYDLGIIIIPKTKIDELMQVDLISQMKRVCKKIGFMQEGPCWYFQDYPMEQQIWFYNTLMEMDVIFAHNQTDVEYYKGLTGKENVFQNKSLIIEDKIEPHIVNPDARDGVIIGGNIPLNCAYHGIPCIGYKGLDTQELCFPKLSVDVGDLERAKVLSQHLKVDKHFYKECGDMAKEKFNTLYSENVYIYNMKKVIEKVMLND
jgi:hypothetical protein